jgi:hypothetical protein
VRVELIAGLIFAVVPGWLFAGAIGPFRAPGLEGEGLYGQLFAGAMVRRWLTGACAPAVADIGGGVPWWPVSPMGAALQAALPIDPAWALGLVIAGAVWLAGYGPWRLVRVHVPGGAAWAAVLAGVAVQTSPVVLRAVPGVDLAALAVGPIALGLAHPRLAWIGGAWSLPGAALFAVFGLFRRNLAWGLAGLPVLAALVSASPLPGAMTRGEAPAPTVPAYVAEGGAAFPLPPAEQTSVVAAAALARTGLWLPAGVNARVRGNLFQGPPPTPTSGWTGGGERGAAGGMGGVPGGPGGGAVGSAAAAAPDSVDGPVAATFGSPPAPGEDRPWIGAVLVPLQRLYGGPAMSVGLLAGLLFAGRGRGRGWALAGLLVLVALTLTFGWQAAPGEAEQDPGAGARLALLGNVATLARLPGGGAPAWSALVPVFAVVGLTGLAGLGRVPLPVRVALAAGLALVGLPLENPRLVAPMAALPPDPIRDTLTHLAPDRLLIFPAPQVPYLQGQRPEAEWIWEAALAGQRVEITGEDTAAAGVIGALSAVTAAPVDAVAARTLWEGHTAEPVLAARTAGWRYLVVDLDALPALARPRLDGWLAERAGMPIARDGSRLLYDLSAGPAGAGKGASGPLPSMGEPPSLGEPPSVGEPPSMGQPPSVGQPPGSGTDATQAPGSPGDRPPDGIPAGHPPGDGPGVAPPADGSPRAP